jgi:hypothetical protein
MTDRELSEWAAMAAGYRIASEGAYGSVWVIELADSEQNEFEWNPLHDDGDALRLSVKLDISVSPGQSIAGATWWARPELIEQEGVSETHNGDPHGATRRAIVRAAAAIGQSRAATSSGDSR